MLPAAARRRLGLKAGTKFACRVQGNDVVLTPTGLRPTRSRLVRSKLTGMLVTQGEAGAPVVTGEQIRALLADFP